METASFEAVKERRGRETTSGARRRNGDRFFRSGEVGRRLVTGASLDRRNGDRFFRSGEANGRFRVEVAHQQAAMETASFEAVKIRACPPHRRGG